MKRPNGSSLESLEQRYRQLANELVEVGYMLKGSVSKRMTTCGNRGCQCHASPPQLHGPYWQWSTAVDRKTTTRLLTDEQARLYRDWIDNRKRAEDILRQMQEVSSKAAALLLAMPTTPTAAAHQPHRPPRRRRQR